MTLVVRLLLLKTTFAGNNAQKEISNFQPKMAEIQERYKDDPSKASEEMMKLLKKEWAWPLKWCMMLLVQVPIFIWLYNVINSFALSQIAESSLYSFFSFASMYISLSNVHTSFFGINLLTSGSIVLWIIAAVLIYTQMQLTMMNRPQTPQIPWANLPDMSKMMANMNIPLALVMAYIMYSTASGVWLYIMITTLFSVIQYMIQYRALLTVKLAQLFQKKK